MGLGDILGAVGKGLLSVIPGGGLITAGISMAETIAETVGGETGKKISTGLGMLKEGLTEAGEHPYSSEERFKLEMREKDIKVELAELEYKDAEGGRRLAIEESKASNEYVATTRPWMVRFLLKSWAGMSFFILVAVFSLAAFNPDINPAVADMVGFVVANIYLSFSGGATAMIGMYTGNRTREKLGSMGMDPTSFTQKLTGMFTSKSK